MEHAAFELPLNDEQLKELGRVVVNCGMAEFLLNMHVGMLYELDGQARAKLVATMATARKLEIIRNNLKKIPGSQTRALVKEAIEILGPAINARNFMLHGIWGFDGEKPDALPIVISPKEDRGKRKAAEISRVADQLAIASRALLNAIRIDSGSPPQHTPDRLAIVD